MKLKYRLMYPTIITIFNVCALFAKFEAKETAGVFSLLFCSMFVWAPTLIKKIFKVNIPALFEYAGITQMFFCIGFGSGLGFYYRVGCWDIIAHTVSGILWSFGALWFLFMFKQKFNEWLLLLYCFLFSTTTSVMWEIFEFLVDRVRDGSDMQRSKFESTGVGGLRDTMIDLICNFIGCIIFFGIFYYDKKKRESQLLLNFEAECNRVVANKEITDVLNEEVYGD